MAGQPFSGRKGRSGKEIARHGEHASRWVIVASAAATTLAMAMEKWDYFWIEDLPKPAPEAGALSAVIEECFPLDRIGDAHRRTPTHTGAHRRAGKPAK